MMKVMLYWARENLLVAGALVVFAAIAALVWERREIDAMTYRFYAEQWNESSESTRGAIAGAAADGVITQSESTRIIRSIMAERRSMVHSLTDAGTVEQQRAALMDRIRDGR